MGSEARWCPHCGAEYVAGWNSCSQCGVKLVDRPPPEPVDREPAVSFTPRARRDDDPFVAIWEGPTPQAQSLVRAIEAAHIPVDLDAASSVGDSQIVVPRSYAEEARDALEGIAAQWPSPIDTSGSSFKPAFRIALVVLAVTVLLLMLFAQ